jgi:hypothetical protein
MTDKELERATRKVYYQRNKERYKEYARKWKQQNPEKDKAIAQRYRENHREELRARAREWARQHYKPHPRPKREPKPKVENKPVERGKADVRLMSVAVVTDQTKPVFTQEGTCLECGVCFKYAVPKEGISPSVLMIKRTYCSDNCERKAQARLRRIMEEAKQLREKRDLIKTVCPQCGLVIKDSNNHVTFCPRCHVEKLELIRLEKRVIE